ncbi:MAG: DUF2779 domain-containing protein [Firmicutes bacterium]|nr:DUF2779 domain-containing protein [Bacillota bacterium]
MENLFQMGTEAGEVAHGLFDGIQNVKTLKKDGWPDIFQMCEKTKELVSKDCSAIAEASFSGKGVYCAVDILKNNFDGTWDIYEVKTSSRRIPIYFHDIAFQKYCLEKNGIKINKCHLVTINGKYVREGEIEVKKLFNIENICGVLEPFSEMVEEKLKKAQEVYALDEVKIDLNESCASPYPCCFYKHCSAHLPKNNIFNLYRMTGQEKFEHYRKGIVSFEDIRESKISLSEKQARQLDTTLDDLPPFVDKQGIKTFLEEIKFPIYFLDFETYSSAVPFFDGQSPHQLVPFQYSLHILQKCGTIEHKEFLANEAKDEYKKLAEKLAKDIKTDGGSVVAYNKGFEMSCIKKMADAFPKLEKKLHDAIFRMIDLLDVFQGGFYYNKEMGGSFSIKSVLPALFPNHPVLDYHKNEEIKGGMSASLAFVSLKNKTKTERARIRDNLLKYCHLDTLAMVEIYKELCRVI